MANYETLTWIANGCLSRFKNNTTMVGKVNRDTDDEFGRKGRKIGNVFYFRRSPQYLSISSTTNAGQAVTFSNYEYTEPDSIPIYVGSGGTGTAGTNLTVPIMMYEQDQLLKFDDVDTRINKPVAEQLATDADRLVTGLYKFVANYVGTPGVPLTGGSAYKAFLQAKAILNKLGAPKENRFVIFDPDLEVELADYLKQFQNPAGKISEVFNTGTLTEAAGMRWAMSQDLQLHTTGAVTTQMTSKGGNNTAGTIYGGINASGSAAVVPVGNTSTFNLAAGAGTLTAGDIIQFVGSNAVNLRTKQSLGYLRPYAVTTAQGTVAAAASVVVSPSIETAYVSSSSSATDNPYMNMSSTGITTGTNMLAWGGATTTAKTAMQNLVFCPDAFAFANVKLPLFDGLHMAARATDPDTGLSLRVSQAWNIDNTQLKTRMDMAVGVAGLEVDQAVRVLS